MRLKIEYSQDKSQNVRTVCFYITVNSMRLNICGSSCYSNCNTHIAVQSIFSSLRQFL